MQGDFTWDDLTQHVSYHTWKDNREIPATHPYAVEYWQQWTELAAASNVETRRKIRYSPSSSSSAFEFRPRWPFGCWPTVFVKNISGSSEKKQLSRYLSSLPLNAFSDGAYTTSSGRLFHKLTACKEKKWSFKFVDHCLTTHWSLSAVMHAPFHASVLRPASQVGPMHKISASSTVYSGGPSVLTVKLSLVHCRNARNTIHSNIYTLQSYHLW